MSAPDPGHNTPQGDSKLPDSYLTIGRPGTAEIRVQRSRFIAIASHAADTDAARAVIADQARLYHDSRHVCHAWRLGTPPDITENRNDAGEPGGTAGEPILVEIRKRQLCEVVVVVVRYFGGVKLGCGGLARAYGEAAAQALANAEQQTIRLGPTFTIQFPYSQQKTIQHLLERHAGLVQDETYQATVTWRIWLPHSQWRNFSAALQETTADTVKLLPTKP